MMVGFLKVCKIFHKLLKLVCFDKEVRISSIQRKLLVGKLFAKIYILKIASSRMNSV